MNYRRAPHTAWRTIAGETVVLDLKAKRMVGLNTTAAFVWQTLEVFETLEALRAALVPASSGSTIGPAELRGFLDEMVAAGLIEAGPPDERRPVALTPPESLEPPCITWRETLEQVGMSCAFLPAQNPLCSQAPFS